MTQGCWTWWGSIPPRPMCCRTLSVRDNWQLVAGGSCWWLADAGWGMLPRAVQPASATDKHEPRATSWQTSSSIPNDTLTNHEQAEGVPRRRGAAPARRRLLDHRD